MRALVTGGAGFIGSNLCRLLVNEGHEVIVFDNLASGYRSNLADIPIQKLIIGDVRDASLLEAATDGVETIFHLAASVGNTRSIEHPLLDAQINVVGTLNVLEIARKKRVRKVVVSSSAGIYG